MGFIKDLIIRKKNDKEKEIEYQSSKTVSCKTCKHCKTIHPTSVMFEPPMYECWLHESTFINDYKAITENHCGNYKPTRKYKKYLKTLK